MKKYILKNDGKGKYVYKKIMEFLDLWLTYWELGLLNKTNLKMIGAI